VTDYSEAPGTFIPIACPLAVFFALQRYLARGLLAGALVE
jgi:ABC-type glycerol-3-phosphate transport system permease component